MTIDLTKLAAPFPPDVVEWRVGSTTGDKSKGMALAYISARDVMNRLDQVCGPFGWQSDHVVAPDGKKVTCRIGIRDDDGEWVWKSDGAGETDYEAEKGSYSDSLKRAAVAWQIGRYLYEVESPWVEIEPAGPKSFKIKKSEFPRLRAILPKPQGGAPKPDPKPPVKIEPGAFKVRGLGKDAGASGWATACDTLMRKAKSTDELDAITKDNSEVLAKLGKEHPDLRADLNKTFAEMWKRLDQTALSAA